MSRKRIISDWFNLYSHDVYNFLVYYTGSTDVEDMVQDVFIKAFKEQKNFKEKSSPKTWLISIARNVAIDEIRKRKRKKWNDSISFDERFVTSDDQTPEKIFDDQEEKKDLYLAIQSMKQSYRDVLILRGIKEMTVAETASILNWHEGKVRTNYYRALKALRERHWGRSI
jgi:RNA polymerase sigma-70 factor (ECF subfamily)